MTSFFQRTAELARAVHLFTFLKAVFTCAVVFYFATAGYSFFIGVVLFTLILVFLEFTGLESRRLVSSAAVFVFGVFAIVWNLSPDAYGFLSYALLALVFVTGFYLLYAISRFELPNVVEARMIYYSVLGLVVFLGVLTAAPYHFFLSLFLGACSVYLILKEEFSFFGLVGGEGKFAAAALSFLALEIYYVLRTLPLNFLMSAVSVSVFLFVSRKLLIHYYLNKGLISGVYMMRQIFLGVFFLVLAFLFTAWGV